MLDGKPPNSHYLLPTEFYSYGDSIITRLHTVDRGECMRVMYPEDDYFTTDNMLWEVLELDDDYLTVISAEEFAAQVTERGGSLEDVYPTD